MAKGGGIKSSKGAEGASAGGVGAAAPSFPATDEGVLSALRFVDSQNPGTLMHSMASARAASPLSGDAFDKAMVRLSLADRIIMHHHDYPENLSKETQESLVKHYDNNFHVWSVRKSD